jgi:hypothetical protein
MVGPVCFHPEDCLDGVLLTVDDSGGTGGDEGIPSMGNISSDTTFDIAIGAGLSGIDLRRGTSERPPIGCVRTIDWGTSCKRSQSPYFSIARSTRNDDRVIGALFDCSIRTALEILFKRSYGSTPSMR